MAALMSVTNLLSSVTFSKGHSIEKSINKKLLPNILPSAKKHSAKKKYLAK